MKRIIEIQELNFHYKRQNQLLAGVSLEFRSGTIYGLLGKKDEGKTTLLKLISGLLFPHTGKIDVLGHVPNSRHPKMLQEIFFLPEEAYSSSLGIEQFESIYAPFYPNFSSTTFYGYLNDFIIDATTDCINEMSYIQKKKLFIAFGLSTNAKLLLLDEPTDGLDDSSKEQLERILSAAINDKCCFLITSQHFNDLKSIAGNILIMNKHKIIFNQTRINISKKLYFNISDKKESSKPIVYFTEVLDGYQMICENTDENTSEIDLELLSNAVVENPERFKNIFDS
jgi:ABC-2 type transport system ATP-binding protein